MLGQPHSVSKILSLALAFLLSSCSWAAPDESRAPESRTAKVQLNNAAGPRILEDATRRSIVTDYAQAWNALAISLEQNRTDLLDASFSGYAKDALAATISEQRRTGTRTRYVDRSHNLDVLFYSPDGLSILLRDTAELEMQVMDHDKIVAAQLVTLRYLALLTPTEVRWKVRLLQAVPKE